MARMHELASASPPYKRVDDDDCFKVAKHRGIVERVPNILR